MDRRLDLLTMASLTSLLGIGVEHSAYAYTSYSVTSVIVAKDQYQGEKNLEKAPLFKPHETDTEFRDRIWITSNERTGCAGISVFSVGRDDPIRVLIIDEPGVAYHGRAVPH